MVGQPEFSADAPRDGGEHRSVSLVGIAREDFESSR